MQRPFSDLHKRLEHLTSYVSGMVIIGGNNEGGQSRFARDFVSEQSDAVNLAFLQGKAELRENQYRQQLLTQLLGQVGGDPNYSISQQLGSILSQHPILIAISGAQHLSNRLVKELWSLARQAELVDDCQLTILLVGERSWADAIRAQLDGAQLPVYLPYDFSPSDSEQPQDMSELDQLIASKREAFNERLAKRQQEAQDSIPQPPSSRRGVVLTALVTFVLLFGGLVWWLYGDKLMELATEQAEIVTSPESSMPEPVTKDDENVTAPPVKPTEPTATDTIGSSKEATVVDDWQSALSEDDTPPDNTDNAAVSQPSEHENDHTTLQSTADATQADTPDSATIRESATTPTATESTSELTATSRAPDDAEPDVSQPNYQWDEAQILKWSGNGYILQLAAASQQSVIADFLQADTLSTYVRYQTQRYGGKWYVVITTAPVATLTEARDLLSQLPSDLRELGAFIKPVSQVHNEIQQGYASQSE